MFVHKLKAFLFGLEYKTSEKYVGTENFNIFINFYYLAKDGDNLQHYNNADFY